MICLGIDKKKCRDLDMDDFRHIFDYFLSYNYSPATVIETFIEAVRINCLGDQKIGNKPAFKPVEILSTDPIFNNHDVSGIASRIRLPIFTRRNPPNLAWVNDEDNKIFNTSCPFNNQDATNLHLCCDPNASLNSETGALGCRLASFEWQMDVGSVLVVRQDRKLLYPLHVEALCKYCRYDIMPLFSHSMGEFEPEEPLEKEVVLAIICRPTFVLPWYKLLDEKSNRGQGGDVPYPYDTE
ncbi:hypothetical protein FP744_10003399 [Trichoderma asperellum]